MDTAELMASASLGVQSGDRLGLGKNPDIQWVIPISSAPMSSLWCIQSSLEKGVNLAIV